MRVRPLFAWYDCWIGLFWDSARRRLYVLPVPMLGIVLDFRLAEPRPLLVNCHCVKGPQRYKMTQWKTRRLPGGGFESAEVEVCALHGELA